MRTILSKLTARFTPKRVEYIGKHGVYHARGRK